MSITTWGELTDDHAGRPVIFTFPWEQSPTSAVFVRRGYLSGFDDADGCERWVHFVDYGGEIGVQETSFRVDATVELAVPGSPPPPPTVAPGATDPTPDPEPEPADVAPQAPAPADQPTPEA